jgi:hypothetical protein
MRLRKAVYTHQRKVLNAAVGLANALHDHQEAALVAHGILDGICSGELVTLTENVNMPLNSAAMANVERVSRSRSWSFSCPKLRASATPISRVALRARPALQAAK